MISNTYTNHSWRFCPLSCPSLRSGTSPSPLAHPIPMFKLNGHSAPRPAKSWRASRRQMTAKTKILSRFLSNRHTVRSMLFLEHQPQGTHQGAGHPEAHGPHPRSAGQGLQPDRDRQGCFPTAASRSPRCTCGSTASGGKIAAGAKRKMKAKSTDKQLAEARPGMPASTPNSTRSPCRQPNPQATPAAWTSIGNLPRGPQRQHHHRRARTRRTSIFAPTRRTSRGRRRRAPTGATPHGAGSAILDRAPAGAGRSQSVTRRMDLFPAMPMTDDAHDGAITPLIIPHGDPLACGPLGRLRTDPTRARRARRRLPCRVSSPTSSRRPDEGKERLPSRRRPARSSSTARSGPTPASLPTQRPSPSGRRAKPPPTAATKTAGALRKAKLEGRIAPAGRRGGSGTLMWNREALDRYLQGNAPASVPGGRARTPPEVNGGMHEDQEQWVRSAAAVELQPELLSVSIGERREGFSFEGELLDPKNAGATRQAVRSLPDLKEPEEARSPEGGELPRLSIRKGEAGQRTSSSPERFATYAASLLQEKVEKRQICSSTTEEKWMFALRHIFGLKDA